MLGEERPGQPILCMSAYPTATLAGHNLLPERPFIHKPFLPSALAAAIREALQTAARRRGVAIYFPRLEFCTDNAAMIAMAGLARLKQGGAAGNLAIEARAQWPLSSLRAPGAA